MVKLLDKRIPCIGDTNMQKLKVFTEMQHNLGKNMGGMGSKN